MEAGEPLLVEINMLPNDGCQLLNAKILELQRVVPWLPMWCFVDGALMYVVMVVYRLDIYWSGCPLLGYGGEGKLLLAW